MTFGQKILEILDQTAERVVRFIRDMPLRDWLVWIFVIFAGFGLWHLYGWWLLVELLLR